MGLSARRSDLERIELALVQAGDVARRYTPGSVQWKDKKGDERHGPRSENALVARGSLHGERGLRRARTHRAARRGMPPSPGRASRFWRPARATSRLVSGLVAGSRRIGRAGPAEIEPQKRGALRFPARRARPTIWPRRRGRAAECTGFENQRGASHQGFESSRLRHSARCRRESQAVASTYWLRTPAEGE